MILATNNLMSAPKKVISVTARVILITKEQAEITFKTVLITSTLVVKITFVSGLDKF